MPDQDGLRSQEEPPRDPNTVIVGVRQDARPFSYRLSGPRRSDSRFPRPESSYYDGYVVRNLRPRDRRLERRVINLAFAAREVSASERADFLPGKPGGIDILCDPATITDERLEKLIASAPIRSIPEHGLEGLDDRSPKPGRVCNRLPEPVRERVLTLAPVFRFLPAELRAAARRLVSGRVLYAVKCNPHPFVLQTLYGEGIADFDVASLAPLGFHIVPDDGYYAGNARANIEAPLLRNRWSRPVATSQDVADGPEADHAGAPAASVPRGRWRGRPGCQWRQARQKVAVAST